ncbi:hypothetical protein [Nocardia nova]|uniref:hypothetical protein n=1 Tax=Nocardia nova TaxID=37330 RepID=UPI0015E2DD40|nr:hypothetical protein [Nocardia nova]
MIGIGRQLSGGIADDVGRHLRHVLADQSGDQSRFGPAGEPSGEIAADAFAHRPGDTSGDGPGSCRPEEAGQIESVLAVAGSQLNALRGSVGARPDAGTDHRLGRYLGSHAHRETTGNEGSPLGRDFGQQLLHCRTNRHLDGGGRRHLAHLPGAGNPRPRGHRDHDHRRDVDGQLGVFDVGGTVLELLGEGLTRIDEALQVAAVAAGDIRPVTRHRLVGSTVDRVEGVHHRLIGRFLQLLERIRHIRPVRSRSSHGIFVTVGPVSEEKIRQVRNLRRPPQCHDNLPLYLPDTVRVGAILILDDAGRTGDLVTGRLQFGRKCSQLVERLLDAAIALLRIVLFELRARAVPAPAAPLGLEASSQLLQGGFDLRAQLLELR